MRFLLPSPAATFDEDFQFCDDVGGLTNFCLLIPVHDDEAVWVAECGTAGLYDAFSQQDVDIADLRRDSVAGPASR